MLKILNQGLPAADTQIDPARNLYSERNSKPRIYDTGRDVAFLRAFASGRILERLSHQLFRNLQSIFYGLHQPYTLNPKFKRASSDQQIWLNKWS